MVTEITQYPARLCFAANWQNYEILLILNHLQFISLIFTFRCFCLNCAQAQTFVSYYLENGNFLKLTNLTLGYTFPIKKDNKWIKGVRAYLSGDNLFCITGYSGLDPELSNPYPTYAGIDARDKYPSLRSFTFGLNLTF